MLVSLGLDQHIENLALSVDGPPQVDHSAVDFQIDLVEMPRRVRLLATLSQVGRDHGSEMVHPTPNPHVGHRQSALGQQILDVAKTEREPEIQPDRLVNNLGQEPVSGVADFLHPLGYSATGRTASRTRRDNAVSRHLVTGMHSEDAGQRLRAAGIENFVVARLRAFLADPGAVDAALPVERRDAQTRKRAAVAATGLIQILDDPSNPSREVLLRAVLRRVQVDAEAIEIELDARSLVGLLTADRAQDISAAPTSCSSVLAADNADEAETGAGDPQPIRLVVPARLKRRGNEMKFIVEGAAIANESHIDANLVRLIVRARTLAQRFQNNPAATIEDIAAGEGYGATYSGRLLRLTSLATDIVAAILNGRQAPELTANVLMADTRLPLEWSAQRAVLGFPAKTVAA